MSKQLQTNVLSMKIVFVNLYDMLYIECEKDT
ncbi:MAG: hypothetical protein XD92_0011 [Proteiniphilum acetatigenes]|uniref:Uncharacterized protein n=1 Tax=Proteiniphilum acetatigenes TaxID=294710 RepID=A0A101HL44_9BACT|nr:MAG: hypothetical protein XD92_0011 [Proteiniphilum acetatigenes]